MGGPSDRQEDLTKGKILRIQIFTIRATVRAWRGGMPAIQEISILQKVLKLNALSVLIKA